MQWPSVKAAKVLRALKKDGWVIIRQKGSHRTLRKEGKGDFVFAFGESEEIGPRMLARIAKYTDLTPEKLKK